MTTPPRPVRPSQTKIVATVGPACSEEGRLLELLAAGVDVFRLNGAHGTFEEHEARLAAIRRASQQLNQTAAVLVDLPGPKIRLGELPGEQLMLDLGGRVRFVSGDPTQPRGPAAPIPELTTTYEPLVAELAVGDRVMLADGTVSLLVEEKGGDFAECSVTQSGPIRSRQGVNLPGVKLSIPTLGQRDREIAVWAAGHDIDFVGLSFVRSPDEIRQLQELLRSHGSDAQVIAKIEKPEALARLEEIVEAADGVMVARGDLGVEIDIAEVAVVQKRIIALCNRRRKPVITATQMLDSMQHSRLPTRAEVADVSNAILDGTDATMLSGETAIGQYPREAVEMMHRIALATEPVCRTLPRPPLPDLTCGGLNPIAETTVRAAGRIAEQLDAKVVCVMTASGATALALAKNRNYVPTIGVSHCPRTLRRMCLYWGVIPLADVPLGGSAEVLAHITEVGRGADLLHPGDRVVMVAGTGLPTTAHNMIVVHEVG